MKLFSRFKLQVSAFLMLVMLAASVSFAGITTYAATDNAGALSSEYVTLVRAGAERPGVAFKGDEAGAVQHRFTYPIAVVKDIPKTAGYCIEPFARGVSPSGQEQTFSKVPNDRLDARDKQLLGIMMAGYPNKSHGWSDEDEYMATQIAIQHFVFQHPDKYPNARNVKFNNDNWSHWDNEPIIELAKIIYDEGIANPYNPSAGNTAAGVKAIPANNGIFTDNNGTLTLKIAIEASGGFQIAKLTLPDEIRNIVKSGQGSITVNGRAANFKAYILGSEDSYEGIEIKPGDTEVVISLNKKAAEAYVSTPGQIKTAEVLKCCGVSRSTFYVKLNEHKLTAKNCPK